MDLAQVTLSVALVVMAHICVPRVQQALSGFVCLIAVFYPGILLAHRSDIFLIPSPHGLAFTYWASSDVQHVDQDVMRHLLARRQAPNPILQRCQCNINRIVHVFCSGLSYKNGRLAWSRGTKEG